MLSELSRGGLDLVMDPVAECGFSFSEKAFQADPLGRLLAEGRAVEFGAIIKLGGGAIATARRIFLLECLFRDGAIRLNVSCARNLLCAVRVTGLPTATPRPAAIGTKLRWRLFNYIVSNDRHHCLQNPLVPYSIEFERISTLEPFMSGSIEREKLSSISSALLPLLVMTGLVVPVEEYQENAWNIWDFHDVLFHSNTRARSDYIVRGGTFRRNQGISGIARSALVGRWKTVWSDHRVDLRGKSFDEVMDARCSTRGAQKPIDPIIMLSFLRCLRHAEYQSVTPNDLGCRYPSAGGLDDLDIFWVHEGDPNLPPGIYFFDKSKIALCEVNLDLNIVGSLLTRAQATWGAEEGRPRGLLIATSDYLSIAHKYENIAYRLAMLNAGVLVQTMYLVAAELDIGVCALGTGDSKEFAEAIGASEAQYFAVCEIAIAGVL